MSDAQFLKVWTFFAVFCTILSVGWKLLPAHQRAAFEVQHPRVAGLLRIAVAIGADIVGAARASRHSVLGGKPHPNAALELMRGIEADPERMRALIESMSAVVAERTPVTPPAEPEGQADEKGSTGFVRRGPLMSVALIFVLALGARACRPRTPDGCATGATRCSPDGVPQWCSATPGYWTSGPAARPCRELGPGVQCRLGRSPYDADGGRCPSGTLCGRPIHACLPEGAERIDEPGDGGHD